MRRARFMPLNRRNTGPTRCIWVDTETLSTEESPGLDRHDLWFGWACYSRRHREGKWSEPEWFRFETPEEFWTWCLQHVPARTALYLFAHNAAYDLTILHCWESLRNLDWRLTGAVLDSPPFLATWRHERKVLKAVDSLNLWKVKLEELGEVVGVPKLEMPKDKTDRVAWDRYCKGDVTTLRAMCLKWWGWLKDEDMGSASVTLAAQALTTYRHRFLYHPIFLDNNPDALALSREGYSGGRTDCLTLGPVPMPAHLLDVCSMYPWVMQTEAYPVKLQLHTKRATRGDLERWLERRCVVARVTLSTPEPCYPCRVPGYLLFPVGRFETTLCTPELAHALKRGRVKRVHEAVVYDKAPIFREYVDEFYRRRLGYAEQGDKFGEEVCKLFLNSLYGKFGQRGWKTEIRVEVPWTGVWAWTEIDAETGKVYRMRALGGVLLVESQEGEAPYSHPAIAAHVTAWGRLRHWELLEAAGRDNVHYYDTDSVLVNDRGLERLSERIGQGELGSLKLERTWRTGTLFGPKDYERDGEHVTKGVRKKAVWIAPNQVEQEMWLGLKSLIMRGHTHAPLIRHQTRTLSRIYRKGVRLPSGRTRPWRLPREWGRWTPRKIRDRS